MIALACLLLFATAQVDSGVTASRQSIFGQSPATVMTGNGRLTVAMDAAGRVVNFRWPSAGLHEHSPAATDGSHASPMFAWAVDDGNALHWVGEFDSTQQTRTVIVENGSTAGEFGVSQTAFVHPAADSLYMRLRVTGEAPPAGFAIVWRPSPTSRVLPEVPVAMGNAGAVFTARSTAGAIAAKPFSHSVANQSALEFAAQRPVQGDIPGMDGPAVWLGLETYPEPDAVTLGRRGSYPSSGLPPRSTDPAMTGAVDVGLTVEPIPVDGGWEAWVRISVADEKAGLDDRTSIAALNPERPGQYQRQLEGAERFWELRLNQGNLPGAPGSEERALAEKALLVLLLLQDRTTGAIVRGPVSTPPLGLDRPADSVWASHALARAGFTAEAQRHIRFLATVMRDGRRRTHDGSFADGYHADGSEGVPAFVLDTDHSAWFIWACLELAEVIPAGQRARFLESVRGPVTRAADFVHGWWDPVRRRPLASFDPAYLRDRARPEQLLTTYAAMDDAIALVGQGEDRIEWVSRRAELRALIDYHLVDENGDWRLGLPTPYWPTGAFPLTSSVWDRVLAGGIPAGEQVPAHEQARAWYFRVEAAAARQLSIPSNLAPELARIAANSPYAEAPSQGGVWPDSLTAAYILLALTAADSAQTQSTP